MLYIIDDVYCGTIRNFVESESNFNTIVRMTISLHTFSSNRYQLFVLFELIDGNQIFFVTLSFDFRSFKRISTEFVNFCKKFKNLYINVKF